MASVVLTNPGIADRIEQDTPSFFQYGFRFERDAKGRGVLHSVPLTDDIPDDAAGPGCNPPALAYMYHLWVDVPAPSLVPTVGPFLRTLVRLTDDIDPRTLRVVVSFDWSAAPTRGGDDGVGVDDANAAAHHAHMLVRNSMGAALFLTSLSVLLPRGLPAERVRAVMAENADVDYPTIRILTRDDEFTGASGSAPNAGKGLSVPPVDVEDYLRGCGEESARIAVRTRMCTVRLTPVLYHLARALRERRRKKSGGEASNVSPGSVESMPSPVSDPGRGPKKQIPLLFACVDKVANLYRIVMLARDYQSMDRLVLVVRDEATCDRFAAEINNFIAKLEGTDGGSKGRECKRAPRVVTVKGAVEILDRSNESVDCSSAGVVAVDLHEDALTLDGDNGRGAGEVSGGALQLLYQAWAVIWGFEKDGIPPSIAQLACGHVQVRCRSSLNLVAAMSIVIHRGWAV